MRIELETWEELFVGPRMGRDVRRRSEASDGTATGRRSWDEIGRTLGEAGVERLLNAARDDRRAGEMVLNFARAEGMPSDPETTLREYFGCRSERNRRYVGLSRRGGMRAFVLATGILGLCLLGSLILTAPGLMGEPGAIRTLLSEAMVIAGWVALWRPTELILIDPMPMKAEIRLIRRVLEMRWRVVGAEG